MGRLTKARRANEAEFAVLISDESQGRGLGRELVRRLLEVARAEKLERVIADILPENQAMLAICRALGFRLRHTLGDGVVRADFEVETR
jgi:acetyltransferase